MAHGAQSVSLVNRAVQLTSRPETIEEEGSEVGSPGEEDPVGPAQPGGKPPDGGLELPSGRGEEPPPPEGAGLAPAPKPEEKDAAEIQKRRRLEQAGIKVMPAAQRFARLAALAPAGLAGFLHARGCGIWLASRSFRLVFPLPCFSCCIPVCSSEHIEIENSLCLGACLRYLPVILHEGEPCLQPRSFVGCRIYLATIFYFSIVCGLYVFALLLNGSYLTLHITRK